MYMYLCTYLSHMPHRWSNAVTEDLTAHNLHCLIPPVLNAL